MAPAIRFLIAILEGYDIQTFGVAAQSLGGELKLDAAALGIAGSAAMAGLMIGAFAGGILSGRIGPKLVLLWSIGLFAIFSLATALSQSFTLLVLARLATGIGFGGAMPNLVAVAMRLRPGGRHAGLTTLIFCGMPTGGALTALVANLEGTPFAWRPLFLIGGAAPLLILPLAAWLLPSFPPARQSHGDKTMAWALFAEGRALTTLLLWFSFICALLLLYLLLNWLPLLVVGKGFAPAVGVWAALVFNLGGVVVSFLLGRWADRTGVRPPLLAAVLFLIAGMFVMLAAETVHLLLISAVLIGAGTIAMQYLLYAAAPMPYPGAQSVAAAGAAIGLGRLGSILGPLLAGILRQSGFSVNMLLAMMLPVAALAGVSGILAVRRVDLTYKVLPDAALSPEV